LPSFAAPDLEGDGRVDLALVDWGYVRVLGAADVVTVDDTQTSGDVAVWEQLPH
jgi:hypothetical protein